MYVRFGSNKTLLPALSTASQLEERLAEQDERSHHITAYGSKSNLPGTSDAPLDAAVYLPPVLAPGLGRYAPHADGDRMTMSDPPYLIWPESPPENRVVTEADNGQRMPVDSLPFDAEGMRLDEGLFRTIHSDEASLESRSGPTIRPDTRHGSRGQSSLGGWSSKVKMKLRIAANFTPQTATKTQNIVGTSGSRQATAFELSQMTEQFSSEIGDVEDLLGGYVCATRRNISLFHHSVYHLDRMDPPAVRKTSAG